MGKMKTQLDFQAGAHIAGELYFNSYSMLLEFSSSDAHAVDQNTAMERINYFIYEVVQKRAFISETDTDIIDNFAKASIPVLATPGPFPVDPVVIATLTTKMNAITGGVITITKAELTSSAGGGIIYSFEPGNKEDDLAKFITNDDHCWWNSAEPIFTSYPTDRDLTKIEKKTLFSETWKDIGLAWLEEPEPLKPTKKRKPRKNKKDASTIIKADFTNNDE